MRIGSSILLSVLLCGSLRAQDLQVTRTAPNPIANFNVSYIDITGRGGGPMLFQLRLLPSPTGAPSEEYYIHFLATCTTSVVDGLLLEAKTGRFTIPRGGLTITSNQFFTDQGDSMPGLHTTEESLDAGARQAILSAGILPAGRVTLDFTLHRVSDGRPVPGASARTWFDIVTVRYVKLVTPGIDVAVAGERIPEVFSQFPQFVWSSDLLPITYPPGTVKFVLAVYENPDNALGAADIPDSRPIWVDSIPGETSVNYAQYPVSGVRALKPGSVYYWQVTAVLQGPVRREVPSELYAFRVADMTTAGKLSPTQEAIMQYLAIILGPNYAYVLPQLRGSIPDETVMLDGKPVDLEVLAEMAQEHALGQRAVTHVELE